MNPRLIKLAAISLFGFAGIQTMAQPIWSDTYWGGTPVYTNSNIAAKTFNYDVVGALEVFDLTGYEVVRDLAADTLEVIIHGNYFDDLLLGQNLETTQMGDLFISTDGLVDNDTGAATLTDYFKSSQTKAVDYTTWEYGVQLGTYLNNNSVLSGLAEQAGDLHQITDPDSQIGLSYLNKPWSVYRSNQEVSLNFAHDAQSTDASWYIDTTGDNNFLSITINNFNSLFGTYGTLGFHWTMTCGNDVLEFEWTNMNPIPEPRTVALYGVLGMAFYLYIRRRLTKLNQ